MDPCTDGLATIYVSDLSLVCYYLMNVAVIWIKHTCFRLWLYEFGGVAPAAVWRLQLRRL